MTAGSEWWMTTPLHAHSSWINVRCFCNCRTGLYSQTCSDIASYFRNGTRWCQSCCRTWIGNHMRSIEWCHFPWPSVTSNLDFKVELFFEIKYVKKTLQDKGHTYHWTLIGSHIQSIKWRHFQWPWINEIINTVTTDELVSNTILTCFQFSSYILDRLGHRLRHIWRDDRTFSAPEPTTQTHSMHTDDQDSSHNHSRRLGVEFNDPPDTI